MADESKAIQWSTTPQISSKKQLRTLTRTAEMDTDGDTDDAEVEAIVGDLAATQQEHEASTSLESTDTTITSQPDQDPTNNLAASPSSCVDDNAANNRKPFKIKDVTRNIRKSLVAATLAEMRAKVAEKFNKLAEQLPTIHLDSDGTEIDDEEYFRTLEDNAELIAVFHGQQWLDPTDYTALTVEHERNAKRSSFEAKRLSKLVGHWQQSLLNDADLDTLSNMDPNSLTDITGKELIEHIRDSDYFLQSETIRSTELSC